MMVAQSCAGGKGLFAESAGISFIRSRKMDEPSAKPILSSKECRRWEDRGFVRKSASWS
jgi:hypothetical protein